MPLVEEVIFQVHTNRGGAILLLAPAPPPPPPPQFFFSPTTILVIGYSPPKKLEPAPQLFLRFLVSPMDF